MLLQLRASSGELELELLELLGTPVELIAQRHEMLLAARDKLFAFRRVARVGVAQRHGLREFRFAQLERVFATLELGHQRKGFLRRSAVPGTLALCAVGL